MTAVRTPRRRDAAASLTTSKRTEVLENRPVNLDGFVEEWPEKGLVAMESDFDPQPSVRVEDGRIVELDGRTRDQFDFMDTFIADHAIDVATCEDAMATEPRWRSRGCSSTRGTSRADVVAVGRGLTPAKILDVVKLMNVVEIMMGIQKTRSRRTPANQAHSTSAQDNPIQVAVDAAEGALRGFAELETTLGVVRYAPLVAIGLQVGGQVGRGGVLTQCALEEATELDLGMRGITAYAETISIYGTESVFVDGDDTPWSKAFLASAYASPRHQDALHVGHRVGGADGQRRGPLHAVPGDPLHPHGQGRRGAGPAERLDLLHRRPGRGARRHPRGARRRTWSRAGWTWSAPRATTSPSRTRRCAAPPAAATDAARAPTSCAPGTPRCRTRTTCSPGRTSTPTTTTTGTPSSATCRSTAACATSART